MPEGKIEAVGLPVPLKAWKARPAEPLLTMHCGEAGCEAEVGAVYTSPQGPVVESRMHPRSDDVHEPPPSAAQDVAGFGAGLGITGMVDEFTAPGARAPWLIEPVRAQIDLLRSELYWHDPVPACPRHGALRVEQAGLDEALRDGQTRYHAEPV